MITRHTDAGQGRTDFFPVDAATEAAPPKERVSPPRRPRGRPESAAKPAGKKLTGKPYKSFPLTPHRSGQFCKKIRGKIFYFGKVSDPDAALKRYHEHCDGLHSGKTDRVERRAELTVAELANQFLAAKDAKRENGDLTPGAFVEYHRDCQRLVAFLGKDCCVLSITRQDLADLRSHLALGVNAVTLSNRIGAVRSLLKFAYDEELIDRPVRFGKELKRPEQRLIRRSRAKAGRRHFFAGEIRAIVENSKPMMRAMILLGINCGLGNKDVAYLPAASVDLERGWLDYPRGKTGVERRCPLWPETVAAIRASNALVAKGRVKRDSSADGLLFVTRAGLPFVREEYSPTKKGKPSVVLHDAIKTAIQRQTKKAGISLKGLGFYGLRRSFETIGSETGNQVAVDHVMGHAPRAADMGAVYRQHVAESALRQVTDHVHDWLFGKAPIEPRLQK